MTLRRRKIQNKSTEGDEKPTRYSHESKVHPSPCYAIVSIKKITNFMVVLSVVIVALDHVQLVMSNPSAVYKNDANVRNQEDIGTFRINEDGVADKVETLTASAQMNAHETQLKSANQHGQQYEHEHPMEIAFLRKVVDTHRPFIRPTEPIQHYIESENWDDEEAEDDEYYYYEKKTVVEEDDSFEEHLPESFEQFYLQSPDVDTHFNLQLQPNKDDELGHVFTEEDYEDDELVEAEDSWAEFFMYDDDVNRSPKIEEDGTRSVRCTRPSWYRQHNPTCNKLHEMPILRKDQYVSYYLASGSYRDAFMLEDDVDDFVLKVSRFSQKYDKDLLEMIRIDAMVMDLLLQSPRVVNLYSHCGFSLQVEAIHGTSIQKLVENEERYYMYDPPPPPLTPTQKLTMAKEMAEGLADLHGFSGGTIVHHDVQILQYLIDENQHAIMSDFNRADALLYDKSKEEYCKVQLGAAHGELRSPEEYENDYADEKSDVYSFGNVIYTLLTGKYPYEDADETPGELSTNGIVPRVGKKIRGNSFAESALATVMDKCYEYVADNRVDIFTVIALLNDAIALNEKFENIELSEFANDDWEAISLHNSTHNSTAEVKGFSFRDWLPW